MIGHIHREIRQPQAELATGSEAAVGLDASPDALCDNSSEQMGRAGMDSPNEQMLNTLLVGLLARIAGRDEAALAEIYDATVHRIYALALRISGERQAAEEIVSDVYFQIWNQVERYDPARGRVLAWMMIVCRSRALDQRRRRDTAEPHPDPSALCADLATDDNDPLDLLLVIERNSAVGRALTCLGARERSLLSMAFFGGLTHQEIAHQTGMPLGSIKSILRRSMQTLRPLLDQANVSVKESS